MSINYPLDDLRRTIRAIVTEIVAQRQREQRVQVPALTYDPPSAQPGDYWYRTDLHQLSVMEPTGVIRRSAVFT